MCWFRYSFVWNTFPHSPQAKSPRRECRMVMWRAWACGVSEMWPHRPHDTLENRFWSDAGLGVLNHLGVLWARGWQGTDRKAEEELAALWGVIMLWTWKGSGGWVSGCMGREDRWVSSHPMWAPPPGCWVEPGADCRIPATEACSCESVSDCRTSALLSVPRT